MMVRLATDFEKLEKAISRLKVVVSLPENHAGRIEASIQCLEFVVELYWKLLKHMLSEKGIIANTPRDALKEAFSAGFINHEEMWISMLKDRNLSSHTYNEDLANEIVGRIPSYLPIISETFEKLKGIVNK
jgi:nucleotidyltransferase substrate binding protein (TIGR01987 family)